MATEIKIPKLGLTMTEAAFNKWNFEAGQEVSEGEVIALLETDKVSFELESPAAGLLVTLASPGDKVEVAQVVGYIAADQAEMAGLGDAAPAAPAAQAAPAKEEAPAPAAGAPAAPPAQASDGERLFASPLARAMAQEHGLDLSAIAGSGPNGRVIKRDIEKALTEGTGEAAAKAAAPAPAAPAAEGGLSPMQETPISGVRKIIFENMHFSLAEQAQLTLHTEVCALGMMELRDKYKERGQKLPYNAILVKALAQAIGQHPQINCSVEGDVIKVWNEVHVGVAMDVGNGLVVPKVRNAQAKSLAAISQELGDLVGRAKENQLLPDDLMGGTITITNLGAWDVDHFTPIVNPPESAILGAGRIVEKPVVFNGSIIAEPRMGLSLTFDHRVIDGAPAAAFLKTLKDMISDPMLMI
jgi:pyruvate dehydrogenase E2 component (dihydrolipoamide acetyltransferase)